MRILLASASPRRSQLLRSIGVKNIITAPANVSEDVPDGTSPKDAVAMLSARKAEAAAALHPGELVLAADTLVALPGRLLGKPSSKAEASEMLRSLSGREHSVLTGVCIIYGARRLSAVEETVVRFRRLSDDEISAYVDTSEPMDKAGAYAIQGIGALFVESICGDYSNVVGLPLCRLGLMLKEFGIGLRELCDGPAEVIQ